MNHLSFALLGVALLGVFPARLSADEPLQVNPETGETQKQFAARTKWWREAKFGMFIHWGVYSVPADGEWHLNNHQMQVKDYEKYADQFNPVKFDAAKWVRVAKDAGMRYITITSKHHDGFCMFDSKLTDWKLQARTPFKRDPLKELAAECKKAGIKLCFYHSIMDWHHPDYLPRRAWEKDVRPADGASLDRYIEHMKGQLTELLTNYGPIGVIWFDGGWEHNTTQLHSLEVVKLIRKLQPGIIINDRINIPEDHSTPEQNIPAGAMAGGRLWETCMTLNNNWGYARNDHNWKSPQDLVHKLCDIASKGGNFLLNVGPTELGEIPQPSIDNLAQVGKWMKVNGKSIYGTTQGPFKRLPFDGRCSRKGNTLYLQVFSWPQDGKLVLPGLKTAVVSATLLGSGEALSVSSSAEGATLEGQPSRPDALATVVEVKLAGKPVVEARQVSIRPAEGGRFALRADDAEIRGSSAAIENFGGVPSVGYWVDPKDTVAWRIEVPQAGRYRVSLELACPDEEAGSRYTVRVGDAKLGGIVASTGGWQQFQTVELEGTLQVAAGKRVLTVSTEKFANSALMNLRRVILTPAP